MTEKTVIENIKVDGIEFGSDLNNAMNYIVEKFMKSKEYEKLMKEFKKKDARLRNNRNDK